MAVVIKDFWEHVRRTSGNKRMSGKSIRMFRKYEEFDRSPEKLARAPQPVQNAYAKNWPVMREFKRLAMRKIELEHVAKMRESGALSSDADQIKKDTKEVEEITAALRRLMDSLRSNPLGEIAVPKWVNETTATEQAKPNLIGNAKPKATHILKGRQWAVVNAALSGT